MRQGPVDAAAQLPLGEPCRERVDRYQAARVYGWAISALVVGVFEDQLAALLDQSATERDRLPRLDAETRDTMAQPHRVHGPRLVLDSRFQFAQAARQVLYVEPLERTDHATFGLEEQIGDGSRGGRRLVPP